MKIYEVTINGTTINEGQFWQIANRQPAEEWQEHARRIAKSLGLGSTIVAKHVDREGTVTRRSHPAPDR